MKKSIKEMVGGNVREDPTEVRTVMHEHEGSRNANGGRPPYVFQRGSVLSHKALKSQDYMDGGEFSSCHIKPWLPNYVPDLDPLDYYLWGEV
ncbi:hypothetical protein ACTXT7_002090 [Hymenolepis weldensis]